MQNREYLDWLLLQRFPGRTLEELDGMDWLRLQRAWDVGRIVDVEEKRRLTLSEKLKPDAVTDDEWAMIAAHDRLTGEGDDGTQ